MPETKIGVYPVFVIGSPRSGTSILVRALQGAGYAGFNEGNYLSLLRIIERDVDRHFEIFGTSNPQVLISHVNKEELKEKLYRLIADQVNQYHKHQAWFDKTGNPEMIEAVPILRRVWPTSHFIFAKRRAIENIASRLKKFPNHTFQYHCADWSKNMAAWRAIRGDHPDLPAIEVDQRDISCSPVSVAAVISRFLGTAPDAESQMARIFGSERPQQTEPGSAERTMSLSTTGWSESRIEVFHNACDPQMRAYGYSDDESYRLDPEDRAVAV